MVDRPGRVKTMSATARAASVLPCSIDERYIGADGGVRRRVMIWVDRQERIKTMSTAAH